MNNIFSVKEYLSLAYRTLIFSHLYKMRNINFLSSNGRYKILFVLLFGYGKLS